VCDEGWYYTAGHGKEEDRGERFVKEIGKRKVTLKV
jgi:hypothetical protein